jgi:hypothetical protein
MAKLIATAAILVKGVHHDEGAEIKTDKDTADSLVRMGRAEVVEAPKKAPEPRAAA